MLETEFVPSNSSNGSGEVHMVSWIARTGLCCCMVLSVVS
ncbi:hypothetical protein PC123_g24332 [Phytophthora cactorum]|nr:hypothetical protein PC120_g25574 [Phytophthora cactorum]KAG4040123.1 hypothetical protein PC123_g24332 [Phytophthora cactorum]